jgi:hypothetical protein
LVDFVEEVEEQLRSERYASLARRYLPWFGAALAATVVGWLGAWGYQSWNESNIAKASVTFDKAVTALASGDQAAAAAGFAQVAQSGPPAYKTLALMEQANTSVQAGDAKKAARQFDAAAKAAPNEIFRNLAQLRAAQAIMDTAPYAQVETRLKPLIGDKKPTRSRPAKCSPWPSCRPAACRMRGRISTP